MTVRTPEVFSITTCPRSLKQNMRVTSPYCLERYQIFWLVDLMGKIIPYHAGKLDANTDIHLVVFQRNTVLRTPFGKKAAAHTADGKMICSAVTLSCTPLPS